MEGKEELYFTDKQTMDAQVHIPLLTVRSIRPIYNSNITSDYLLELILRSFKTFKGFLNNVMLSDDDTSLLVHLVAKAVKCSRQTKRVTLHRILQSFCDSKLLKEKGTRLLVGVTCSNHDIHSMSCLLSDFLTILTQLMRKMPTLCTTPQIIGFVNFLEMQISECDQFDNNTDIRYLIAQLKSDICNVIEQRCKSSNSKHQKNREDDMKPPNDFRTMSIVPKKDDVIFPASFLRRNKVIGPYLDLDHYLDVQFRLYREDCISPLRDALEEAVDKQRQNQQNFRLENGLIYRKMSIIGKETSVESGEVFIIKLDKDHYKRINWDKSSRLIFGSLLLLSFDLFRTIFFAVVAESDRKSLQKNGSFKVQIYRSGNKTDLQVPWRMHGMMIEATSAYFEAYKHVLKALQNITPSYPFQKYLVHCETKIDSPNYIDEETVYDLGPIITGDNINVNDKALKRSQIESEKQHLIRILQKEEWPTAEELKMDESQRQAFIAALTKEFVLIQGPPGTGKTHLGLQIAKALLHNTGRWKTNENPNESSSPENKLAKNAKPQLPIMSVKCYTNHALDQFVEGIINFIPKDSNRVKYPKVVRFGSRCKNPNVEEFSIQNVRKRVRYNFHNHRHGVLDRADDIKKRIKTAKEMLDIIKNSNIVLNYTTMKCVMSTQQVNSFGDENKNLAWYQWLHVTEQAWCKEIDKVYQNTHEESTEQSDVLKDNEEVLVNIISEADYAYNERYFEVDDMESQVQIDHIGLDLEHQLRNIYKSTPLLEPLCRQIYQTVKEKAEQQIQVKNCMSEAEAEEIRNPWKLDIEERWKLYRYWIKKLGVFQHQQLKQGEKAFDEIFDDYSRASKEMDEEIMRNAVVIAMTTTAAARYHESLNKVCPNITIIEEAAEVPEAHIVSAINHKCQHLILIGDHKQLEPKPAVYKLATNFNLSVSLFERMVENRLSCQCLQRQHRMRPEISTLVRHIYNVLEDNENVFAYEPIKGIKKNLFFITHDKKEKFSTEGRSYSNDYEAEYLKELCQYLLKQGYKGSDITIIAAYSGQMYCIRDKMPRSAFGDVNICVLDNYQGEENEIILLSLVRGNDKGVIGFLNKENRICVALSRARKGLYIIGNRSTLTLQSRHWRKIFQNIEEMDEKDAFAKTNDGEFLSSHGKALPLYCQNHPMNKGILAAIPADFRKAPDGGCEIQCDFRLDCGHACELRCHPVDKEHKLYKCKKLCLRKCLENHTCQKKCHYGHDCCCSKIMERKLQCEHVVKLKCFENYLEYMCTVPVSRVLSCGHKATMECHAEPNTYKCQVLVQRSLTCGHSATIQCNIDPKIYKCQEVITEKRTICGHEITRKCFDANYEQNNKCNEIVVEKRKTCDHQLERKCYDTNYENRQNCEVIITERRSSCGHPYKRKCFDQQFSVREHCIVEVERVFEKCGHKKHLPCHVDILSILCKETVITELECGHTKIHPCHDRDNLVCHSQCNKICKNNHVCEKRCHFPSQCDCSKLIDVILDKCYHEQKMRCSCDLLDFKCQAVVTKQMPTCGHNQTMKCSENPESMKCNVSVLKQFDCGHKNAVACFSDTSGLTCTKPIEINLESCGHPAKIICWQKDSAASYVKCKELVPFERPECGHNIDIECYTRHTDKKLPPCDDPVEINLPCGHKAKRSCSNVNVKTQCEQLCGKKLFCGHQCFTKCKTCQTTKHHGECRTSCGKQLLCGHDCKSKSCMDCSTCDKVCSFSCSHSKCGLKCCDQCKKCTQKCSWQCPHFKCRKTCSEICTRPRCTKRCYATLHCGHKCTGFCGDPCPDSCITCKPDIYNFKNLSKGTKTVTLTCCGHTFESDFIDDHIKRRKNDIILKCPICKATISHHPRYNATLKRNKALLENAKQQIREMSTTSETNYPAPHINFIQDVQGYVSSFATFLHICQHTQRSKELLEMTSGGQDLIIDINKLLRNSDHPTFLCCLYIFEMVQKIFLLWCECLLYSKPFTLSKTYTISSMDWTKHERLQQNKRDNAICLTGREIIKRLHTVVPKGKKNEVMIIIRPLTDDFGRDTHFYNAIRYPEPSPVIGIHHDEWSFCKKGHIYPCLMDKTCFVCEGAQTSVFDEMPLPNMIRKTPVTTNQSQASGIQKRRDRRRKGENSNAEKTNTKIPTVAEKASTASACVSSSSVQKYEKSHVQHENNKQSRTKPSQSIDKDKTVPFSKGKQSNQANKSDSNRIKGARPQRHSGNKTEYYHSESKEGRKPVKEDKDKARDPGDKTKHVTEDKEEHLKSHHQRDSKDQGRGRGDENRGRVRQFHGLGRGRGRGKRC